MLFCRHQVAHGCYGKVCIATQRSHSAQALRRTGFRPLLTFNTSGSSRSAMTGSIDVELVLTTRSGHTTFPEAGTRISGNVDVEQATAIGHDSSCCKWHGKLRSPEPGAMAGPMRPAPSNARSDNSFVFTRSPSEAPPSAAAKAQPKCANRDPAFPPSRAAG